MMSVFLLSGCLPQKQTADAKLHRFLDNNRGHIVTQAYIDSANKIGKPIFIYTLTPKQGYIDSLIITVH